MNACHNSSRPIREIIAGVKLYFSRERNTDDVGNDSTDDN